MSTPRPRGRRAGVLALLGLAALAAAALTLRARPAPLPVLAELPPFELVDHHGAALTRERLAGRVWIAGFIFTRCGGVCPAMTARMAKLRAELPAEVLLVSFSVDPGHDTPPVLARYAADLGAPAQGWLFVTGAQPALHALSTQGFKLAAFEVPPDQQQGGDGPFLHSGKLVLVDAAARLRGYYDSGEAAAMARLAADVRRLAASSS